MYRKKAKPELSYWQKLYRESHKTSREKLLFELRQRNLVIQGMAQFHGCAICGYTGGLDDYCLCFHHINKEDRRFSVGGAGGRTWESIFAEMDKCIILCSTCHIKFHAVLAGNKCRNPTPEFIEWVNNDYPIIKERYDATYATQKAQG